MKLKQKTYRVLQRKVRIYIAIDTNIQLKKGVVPPGAAHAPHTATLHNAPKNRLSLKKPFFEA